VKGRSPIDAFAHVPRSTFRVPRFGVPWPVVHLNQLFQRLHPSFACPPEQRSQDVRGREGVAEGEFEVVDIQVATFAILALLTGLTTWYRPGGRLTKEAIVAAHEKLVLSSVAPGATPSRAPTKRSPSPSTATRGSGAPMRLPKRNL